MYILAFDYGHKKIGVAIGQRITSTANPLQIIHAKNHKPDWQTIERLIKEWQPEQLVVGLPLHADGSASNSTQAAQKFMRQLQGRFNLPVHAVDETLSSHAATERLGSDTELDAVAAQIILETWFAHTN